MKHRSQQGVALVITLVMLSIVTIMALLFLGLSRRERASVKVTQDQTQARFMADSAISRAQAQLLGGIMANTNILDFDYQVSTNYINPLGFNLRFADSITNVAYTYNNGNTLQGQDNLRNLANLYLDPRPPVFIPTNDIATDGFPSNDFRFYLDLNRNGMFESNGVFRVVDRGNNFVQGENGVLFERTVGDPEWVGVLENPAVRHSGTNRFVGRFAYAIVPETRTLDLNTIHNRAKNPVGPINNQDGFTRNQGFGSWEINLAGFLTDLNTNVWTYQDRVASSFPSAGSAFDDATTLLRHRYNNNYNNLRRLVDIFGPAGAVAFENDGIDGFANGPLALDVNLPTDLNFFQDNDSSAMRWPGDDNPSTFTGLQELFTLNDVQVPNQYDVFRRRLHDATNAFRGSTYDRYMFYRMMGQLGTDSRPAWDDKINLNYVSEPGAHYVTNFVPWTRLSLFTNIAERLVRSEYNFGITNIPVYPTNFYSAQLHRLLQVAANMVDSTTNNPANGFPFDYPSVFKPRFSADTQNNQIVINGFDEIHTANTPAILNLLTNNVDGDEVMLQDNSITPQFNTVGEFNRVVRGIPFVIGARKGYPNFNEFELRTFVQVSRRLEVVRPTPLTLPVRTNQMHTLSISNVLGVEFWNSYDTNYSRPLNVYAKVRTLAAITNLNGAHLWSPMDVTVRTNIVVNNWEAGAFEVPILQNLTFVPDAKLISGGTPRLEPDIPGNFPKFESIQMLPPGLGLAVTNEITAVVYESAGGQSRIVDFVNLTNLVSGIDITSSLIGNSGSLSGEPSVLGRMWDTNAISSSMTAGVMTQIQASMGNEPLSATEWTSFNQMQDAGMDKEKSIDFFRVFHGFTPLYFQASAAQIRNLLRNTLNYQVPFTPTRKVMLTTRWAANDPLVHYTEQDLFDLRLENLVEFVVPPQIEPDTSNLGRINDRYRPWRGNPNLTAVDGDYRFQDPLIYQSDDWNFPAQKFPNIGWAGRVHRGTPWQTLYLKGGPFDENFVNEWILWSGHVGTHPTNDWKFLDHFTVAPNANAARGLLSVNQDGLAAWSGVLSGVNVLTNTLDDSAVNSGGRFTAPQFQSIAIQPTSSIDAGGRLQVNPQVAQIVRNINQSRQMLFPGRRFPHMGSVLSATALTVDSPFLNLSQDQRQYAIPDAVYERIPQQILSLLQPDSPRFTVYAYGQSLEPAEDSIIATPTSPFFQICTNYQITGEVATKTVFRFEGPLDNLRTVVEDFQILSAD